MSCCAPSEAATAASSRWKPVRLRASSGWLSIRFSSPTIVQKRLWPAGTVAVRNHDLDVFLLLSAGEFEELFEETVDAG